MVRALLLFSYIGLGCFRARLYNLAKYNIFYPLLVKYPISLISIRNYILVYVCMCIVVYVVADIPSNTYM